MQVERRSSPRHPLKFTVKVQLNALEQPLEFEAESLNISSSNIEISCNNLLIDALLAQESYPHTCELSFKLPDNSHEFTITAQVLTHRRLSQKQFYLVLNLDNEAKESIELLTEYLSEMRPGNMLKARGIG